MAKKTLTLRQFEKKYDKQFLEQARKVQDQNFRQLFLNKYKDNPEIKGALKKMDYQANVGWPLAHIRSAAKYLHRDPKEIKATGGTNWQQYLPPRKQMITFFPELWTEEELTDWGKKPSFDA